MALSGRHSRRQGLDGMRQLAYLNPILARVVENFKEQVSWM